ncbi:MAG: FMN-binding protein [Deltaproteobacteria bacterium]|nr:FMN-binding protein [Deltaproteobacteria bacterium]MBW2417580.1 FMN-binding protein [Deltaproteobacteria bacterium]
MSIEIPVRPELPSWRLVMTLAVAGTLAGTLIVFVFQATEPAIQAHKAEMLRLAIHEVLKDPERYETLYVIDGALASQLPEGRNPRSLQKVFVGYDGAGKPVGAAMVAGAPGFQDVIRLIFGYDPATRRLLGMKVLESKETPGLGDKIEKDMDFVGQFDGAVPPLQGVKQGQAGEDRSKIDMITGATISSRAIIKIIGGALEELGPLVDVHEAWQP